MIILTDQVYYKIQYPLKKAISTIKKVDIEDPVPDECAEDEVEEIRNFLDRWEQEGKEELKSFIKELKQSNK